MTLKKLVPTVVAMFALLPFAALADPVNINTADATELAKSLNGIGPAKAQAIVSYREKNGPFKSADQLALVEGISQKLIDRNRSDIRLGNDKAGAAAPAAKGSAPKGESAKAES